MEKFMMIWLMWRLDPLFTRDGSLYRMQNSALVCVSGRATSEAGNSSSLLFNSSNLV